MHGLLRPQTRAFASALSIQHVYRVESQRILIVAVAHGIDGLDTGSRDANGSLTRPEFEVVFIGRKVR